jgi:hypothetical protein
MALSMVEGRSSVSDGRELLYRKANLLVDEFQQAFGYRDCPDLIQIQLGTPEASAEYETRGLKAQCEGYIRAVAARTVELLLMKEQVDD